VLPEEKKLCEGKSPEERMVALRAYHRAKGLCIRCAEKWTSDHKCATTVELHVVQELLEFFNMEDIDQLSVSSIEHEQLFFTISCEAMSGLEGPCTLTMKGMVQGREALILVDSGSTNTFINKAFVDILQCTP
jgi:hypothetical protein